VFNFSLSLGSDCLNDLFRLSFHLFNTKSCSGWGLHHTKYLQKTHIFQWKMFFFHFKVVMFSPKADLEGSDCLLCFTTTSETHQYNMNKLKIIQKITRNPDYLKQKFWESTYILSVIANWVVIFYYNARLWVIKHMHVVVMNCGWNLMFAEKIYFSNRKNIFSEH